MTYLGGTKNSREVGKEELSKNADFWKVTNNNVFTFAFLYKFIILVIYFFNISCFHIFGKMQ